MKIVKILSVVGALFISVGIHSSLSAQIATQNATHKFGTLLSMLDRLYVDSVNTDELVETAIVKMLEELDPHSILFRRRA